MKSFSSVLFVLMSLLFCNCKKDKADMVIYGGAIYTMNEKMPTAEAIAVKGNTISFVGSKDDAESLIDVNTQVIDLQGKTLTPGFIEGHAHLLKMGLRMMRLDLTAAKSFNEISQIVQDAVSKAQPNEWIIGEGWHQEKWVTQPAKLVRGFPVHTDLSKISPDNPVYLRHASGHAAFVNARAMEVLGVNPLKREPGSNVIPGGEIIVDENGNPTGLFNEQAVELITSKIRITENEFGRALDLAMWSCLENGITTIHDAGENEEELAVLKKFRKENKLKVRLYVMLMGSDTALVNKYLKTGIEIDPDHWLTIRSIKYYGDGALGSRGAWLLEPYSDSPENHGNFIVPMDSVYYNSRRALAAGFQVCTHAIGDRANREVLNQYEKVLNENPLKTKDHRFRIEHVQHLHPDDIGRFARLGVLPAMQGIHMSSDRPWAIDRLGEKRIQDGAYVWQSLLKTGSIIINGTDSPVEPLNPLSCFYASVTRKTLKGQPEGGYEADQKMTREQALRSYTLSPAYGAFEEELKGSIEVGKLADFTVFTKDIMTIPENEILKTKVAMTIIDGKVVFGQ
jgi:predicted amidohydrolase YtcJ